MRPFMQRNEKPEESEWKLLGQGSFNTVYKSSDNKLVFKVQHKHGSTDTPYRSVRLWNQINPHLFPLAEIKCYPGFGIGWVCPFVEGRQATDAEMCKKLIDIFNNTAGRIVVDAISKNNFVTTPQGETVCIDIAMAVKTEEREDDYFDSALRRKSVVSLETWADLQKEYVPWFDKYSSLYPDTVKTIKALLYIKSTRPDIYDADF